MSAADPDAMVDVDDIKGDENKSGPKNLTCSGCKRDLAPDAYSAKQIKNKGKRKCKECAGAQNVTDSKPLTKEEKEAKLLVKTLKADDVKRAQTKDGPEAKMTDKEQDKFQIFLKWLKEGGVKYPHLYLKYYAVDYRGVHSVRRLNEEQVILEVPHKMIMTSEVAKESDIGQKIIKSGYQVRSTHSYLAAYLCQEKHNAGSVWRAYIDTLPQHYRNMPIYFDQDELSFLKGSFTLQMIDDRKESLKAEYDGIVKHVPEFAKYSLDDFIWARLAVITRIFGLKIRGHKTDGLVPMADMLNHKIPKETSWTFDDSVNGFTITTSKRLLKGAQIFDSYGRKCNSRFFVNYGFSLEENDDNQVAMYFDLPKSDSETDRALKAQIVGTSRRWQIPADYSERVTKQCFAYLRVAFADSIELLYVIQFMQQGGNIKKLDGLSIDNEWKVCQDLGRAAKEILARFDTTLEQDNKILEDPEQKLTMNVRNAILQRRGEKRVLHYYIELAKETESFNTMDWKQFKNVYQKFKANATFMEKYMTEIWLPLFKEKASGDVNEARMKKLEELKSKQAKDGKPLRLRKLDDPDTSDSD